MTLIFDEEDGLGFYVGYALARQAFADPRLVCAQPYRGVISGCLRAAGVSPVPAQRGSRVPDVGQQAQGVLGSRW